MHQVMVVQAQEGEILQIGPAAGLQGTTWWILVKVTLVTAREAAVPVPAHDLAALGRVGLSAGPALVHGVADVVVDRDGEGGVTGDLAHDIGADEAVTLELAGEGALLARGSSTRAAERHVDDDDVGAPTRGGGGTGCVGPRSGSSAKKASQRRSSKGVSPSVGTARARASSQARVSAKDAGGSCTVMVRHCSLKRTERRSSSERARGPRVAAAGRATSPSWRTEHPVASSAS